MEELNQQKGIYNRSVIEFITVANQYCVFLETQSELSAKEFVDKSTKLLPLLYLKASLLPIFEARLEDAPETFISEYDYNFILNTIAEKLEDKNDYLEVFHDDIQYSDTPIIAYISENLSDIYQDLKNTISNFELANEDVMNDAMMVCQESFKSYWGQQLVNALRALHQLNYSEAFEKED